jgi:hypothetical protein
MWPFKKKAPKPEPVVIMVPKEHQEKFCELYDDFVNHKGSSTRQKLILWRFIFENVKGLPSGKVCKIKFQHNVPEIEVTDELMK